MIARQFARVTRIASGTSNNMPIALASSRLMSGSSPASAKPLTSTSRPLYASQDTIPHLPVPSLSSTLYKYLETLSPLQKKDEHERSAKLVRSFLESDYGHVLQARLEARAAERPSWLSEWWNDVAYMGYRGRIIPNVSYFYIHKEGIGHGASQTERAASIIRGVVEFKKLVDSEMLEPEKVKGQPLCMASYKYLFNSSRIPTSPADIPLAYPAINQHVVVLRNDRYFKLDVKGRSQHQIAAALQEIKQIADAAPGYGIGVLTAEDRDVWTEARRHLLSVSPANTSALQTIESAMVLICLDDGVNPHNDDERAWSYWAGGLDRGPKGKARNRWFDKHEFIIDERGESGFNGEHSMLDGTPTLRLNEFVIGGLDKGVIPLEAPDADHVIGSLVPEEIKFELDAHLRGLISTSKTSFAEEIGKQDLKMLRFTGYGKNLIKTFKVSPDAWAQMVKQLAFYRLHGRPGVTYESCQTRKFLLGRTEVIRSASNESRAFTEAMVDVSASDADREKKFRAAAARHGQYSAWAADAQGVDRHLFGLRRLVRENEEMPAIFTDPAYARSSHWELSTSQLSSNYLDGWGYGEVVPDGYGLSYSIHDDSLRWGITTLNGDADEFGKALTDAADELRLMMERARDAVPKAKL